MTYIIHLVQKKYTAFERSTTNIFWDKKTYLLQKYALCQEDITDTDHLSFHGLQTKKIQALSSANRFRKGIVIG